jgi:hypothetical protein
VGNITFEGIFGRGFGLSEVLLQEEQMGRLLDLRNDQVHGSIEAV